jgi:putative membrane protein
MNKARHLDHQAFLEALCCLSFSVVLIVMVAGGSYLDYVTPRMKPYLIFAAAVMMAWCVFSVSRMFKARRAARSSHAMVMAIPIILLILPKTQVKATEMSNKYVPQVSAQAVIDAKPDLSQAPEDGSYGSGAAEVSPSGAAPQELSQQGAQSAPTNGAGLPGLDESSKSITVDNDYFYPWLSEISSNLDRYQGYRASFTGFVLKDPEMFAENEFVPARLGMSCCIADLVPYGILCKYDDAPELSEEEWVTVEGVIHAGEYMGYAEAQLIVDKVSPAEEVEDYIYPF